MAGVIQIGNQPPKPAAAQAPQTQVINGQTYLYQGQNSADPYPAGGRSYGPGAIWGNDGSVWNPMQAAGSGNANASQFARPANPDPRYEDFDFYGALAKARSAQSGPLAPAELPAHVTGASPADAAAAQAAEFGRAKDRIGKLGRGTLMSMQEGFDARGFGGSGMEASATQGLLSDLQGQEGEVIRDQAIQNLVRQRQVEDRNYAGDVNQRSQDIGFTTATRGQDATYELGRNQQLAPLMSLIAAHPRRLY